MSITDNKPPLAAVAVGDLDDATLVTYAVPGMGTYTTDMQLWTQSAQNVYDAQERQGTRAERAVVAWIGYITPPPGVDAALGTYAIRGAPLLVNAIQGLYAAREKKEPKYVNVVAHSYGTTLSANALASTNLNIYSFVMLGSAGIETSIRSAKVLHAKYVYAGEATADEEARWGRVSRQDPRSPAFGAWSLAVDGDPRNNLAGVTGHEPVLHSKWNDNIASAKWTSIKNLAQRKAEFTAHQATFGYLDNGTQSLENVARATIPHPFQDVTPAIG
jgi:pimeloyl-ACP methyl ester carboxylesterase